MSGHTAFGIVVEEGVGERGMMLLVVWLFDGLLCFEKRRMGQSVLDYIGGGGLYYLEAQ